MKRKLISVSLALALGLSLAACGSKPAPSGAETPAGELGTLSGPVELQFWHSISNQNHLKVLEGLVEEFNETILPWSQPLTAAAVSSIPAWWARSRRAAPLM